MRLFCRPAICALLATVIAAPAAWAGDDAPVRYRLDGLVPADSPLPAITLGAGNVHALNLKGDALYLHVLKNPRGKNGMPADGKLSIAPVAGTVATLTCMNTGKPVPFAQSGDTLTVDASQVAADPVDTIFKVRLKK